MALKGARSDPVQGVKGAKPRLRLPKLPRRLETETTVQLNEEYLRKRNKILDLKYKREAMALVHETLATISNLPLAAEPDWLEEKEG